MSASRHRKGLCLPGLGRHRSALTRHPTRHRNGGRPFPGVGRAGRRGRSRPAAAGIGTVARRRGDVDGGPPRRVAAARTAGPIGTGWRCWYGLRAGAPARWPVVASRLLPCLRDGSRRWNAPRAIRRAPGRFPIGMVFRDRHSRHPQRHFPVQGSAVFPGSARPRCRISTADISNQSILIDHSAMASIIDGLRSGDELIDFCSAGLRNPMMTAVRRSLPLSVWR